MEDAKWERYAALGGFVFVVLNVAGALIPGAPPSSDDSPAKVATYFKDHAGSIELGQALAGLGTIGLLWWLGSLWRLMCRAENERPRLAVVAAVSLGMSGVLALLSGAIASTTAIRIDDIGEGSKLFVTMTTVVISTAGFCLVAFLAAVSALNYRTKMLPVWLTYVGWIGSAGFLVASFGSASDADVLTVLGLVSFLVWCVWIVGVSASMWRGSAATS